MKRFISILIVLALLCVPFYVSAQVLEVDQPVTEPAHTPNPSMDMGNVSNVLPLIELLISNPRTALVNLFPGDNLADVISAWQAEELNINKIIVDKMVYYHNDQPFMAILFYVVAPTQ
jgi:hypothetical protein